MLVGMTGKALDRGSKHLSKQAVAALRKYQADMDAALTGKTNANVVFVEPKVIGGAKIEQRMMYLLEQNGDFEWKDEENVEMEILFCVWDAPTSIP